MGQLVTNDDGTITVRLRGGKSILLWEPTMDETWEIHALVTEADKKLGILEPLPLDASDEEKAARRTELLQRTDLAFSPESPHGLAMVKIINMLRDDDSDHPGPYESKELPGWLCHPASALQLELHFRTPLPGTDSIVPSQ